MGTGHRRLWLLEVAVQVAVHGAALELGVSAGLVARNAVDQAGASGAVDDRVLARRQGRAGNLARVILGAVDGCFEARVFSHADHVTGPARRAVNGLARAAGTADGADPLYVIAVSACGRAAASRRGDIGRTNATTRGASFSLGTTGHGATSFSCGATGHGGTGFGCGATISTGPSGGHTR